MPACPALPSAPATPSAPAAPTASSRPPAPSGPAGRAGRAGPVTTATALEGPLPVLGCDVRVPLASGGEVPYAALDYAASAPALRRVWQDVADYLPYYASVHRGAGHLSRVSTELFESSRREVAGFLCCRPDDEVVFTRSTTDSLNLLASALPPGTRVHVFETEHHAALLPWQRRPDTTVRYLPAPRSPREAVDTLRRALSARDRSAPALFCVTGASNVTGELWPVRELAAVARGLGARTVLDAAQLAPHRPVDVAGSGVDWVALSGHKLYAPFGAGVLAGRADWLRAAPPYLAGGGASRRVVRDGGPVGAGGAADGVTGAGGGVRVDWHDGPARHEAGSPNVVGAYALASACRALAEAGFDRLVARERRLVERLRAELAAVPGLRVLSLFGDDAPRVGVVSFVLAGWRGADLAEALSAEYGIGVRDGLFCAHPLLGTLLGDAAQDPGGCGERGGGKDVQDVQGWRTQDAPHGRARGAADGPEPEGRPTGGRQVSAVRVSFGVGTPEEHLDRLVLAVRELATRPGGTAAR